MICRGGLLARRRVLYIQEHSWSRPFESKQTVSSLGPNQSLGIGVRVLFQQEKQINWRYSEMHISNTREATQLPVLFVLFFNASNQNTSFVYRLNRSERRAAYVIYSILFILLTQPSRSKKMLHRSCPFRKTSDTSLASPKGARI